MATQDGPLQFLFEADRSKEPEYYAMASQALNLVMEDAMRVAAIVRQYKLKREDFTNRRFFNHMVSPRVPGLKETASFHEASLTFEYAVSDMPVAVQQLVYSALEDFIFDDRLYKIALRCRKDRLSN